MRKFSLIKPVLSLLLALTLLGGYASASAQVTTGYIDSIYCVAWNLAGTRCLMARDLANGLGGELLIQRTDGSRVPVTFGTNAFDKDELDRLISDADAEQLNAAFGLMKADRAGMARRLLFHRASELTAAVIRVSGDFVLQPLSNGGVLCAVVGALLRMDATGELMQVRSLGNIGLGKIEYDEARAVGIGAGERSGLVLLNDWGNMQLHFPVHEISAWDGESPLQMTLTPIPGEVNRDDQTVHAYGFTTEGKFLFAEDTSGCMFLLDMEMLQAAPALPRDDAGEYRQYFRQAGDHAACAWNGGERFCKSGMAPGSYLCFSSMKVAEQAENLGASPMQLIVCNTDSRDEYIAWSRDNKHCLMCREANGTMYILHEDGTTTPLIFPEESLTGLCAQHLLQGREQWYQERGIPEAMYSLEGVAEGDRKALAKKLIQDQLYNINIVTGEIAVSMLNNTYNISYVCVDLASGIVRIAESDNFVNVGSVRFKGHLAAIYEGVYENDEQGRNIGVKERVRLLDCRNGQESCIMLDETDNAWLKDKWIGTFVPLEDGLLLLTYGKAISECDTGCYLVWVNRAGQVMQMLMLPRTFCSNMHYNEKTRTGIMTVGQRLVVFGDSNAKEICLALPESTENAADMARLQFDVIPFDQKPEDGEKKPDVGVKVMDFAEDGRLLVYITLEKYKNLYLLDLETLSAEAVLAEKDKEQFQGERWFANPGIWLWNGGSRFCSYLLKEGSYIELIPAGQ